MRRLIRSRLIWIYTVCKFVSEFTWCPKFHDFRGLPCKPNKYVSWSTSELRVRLVHRLTGLSPPVKYFYWLFQGGASFVDHLCYFCLVLLCFHARLFVDALWSPAVKGLASWLSFNCDVLLWRCHFPIGILGQVWCLIVSIPDHCALFYFTRQADLATKLC